MATSVQRSCCARAEASPGALGGAEPWLTVTSGEGSIALTFDDEMIRERWGAALSLRLDAAGAARLRELVQAGIAISQPRPAFVGPAAQECIARFAWSSNGRPSVVEATWPKPPGNRAPGN